MLMTKKGFKEMIAKKIDNKLKELNLSRSDLAKMMDVSPSEVTKWLKGDHNFTIKTLFKLEEKLGIRLIIVDDVMKISNVPNFLYEKGWHMKDVITGFEGYVVYRVDFLTGCNQYGLQPPIEEGGKGKERSEIPDSKQFDENRLVKTGKPSIVLPNVWESKENVQGTDEVTEPPFKGGPNYIVKT
jgi:transcriptional regulator with XRE-family HTH domain